MKTGPNHLPAGWSRHRLDTVCLSIVDGDWVETKDQGGDAFRLLQVSNIGVGEFHETGHFRYVSQETFERLRCSEIKPGNVLVSRMPDPVGRAWHVHELPWPAITAVDVAIVAPDPTKLDGSYLAFYLNSPRNLRFVAARATGTTRVRITRRDLASFEIPVPPLPVQRKIAAILFAYDYLMEINSRRVKLLEEMARRIYHEWFVEFRYPGHDGVRVMESQVGLIPEGWRLGTLGEVVAVNAETIKRPDPDERIAYVDIASVSAGTVQPPKPISLSEAPGRARRRVRDGDVIWSTVRPNLRSYALMLDPGYNTVASTGFAVLSPRRASFAYIYAMTTTDLFVEYLSRRASGSAYPAVTPPVLVEAPALIPAADVLKAFADVTEPLLRLASKLRSQSTNLANARDLLLPRLISGEIDVTNLDITVHPAAA